MRIVMDFDGVYTDPSEEGEACSKHFRNKILSLQLKQVGLETVEQIDSWIGELRIRGLKNPFDFGWRSEGRVSAFTFEDPFIRNIGLADFLDHLVAKGDEKAKTVLALLTKQEKIKSFGELSEWSFHQLNLKKRADMAAKRWVEEALKAGHDLTIVSNSASDKIEEFLTQNNFAADLRPKVRGGARKFGLGKKANLIVINENSEDGTIRVDTDRPLYEQALLDLQPDAVIGDVFCLDLALPIRLKREGKLAFKGGIYYRHREYTPSKMIDLVTGRGSQVPEVKMIREWSQFALS
jgi:hypothetical protein